MWACRFLKPKTRSIIPTFKNFLKQNHDIPKLWFEETFLEVAFRTHFFFRIFKFVSYLSMYFIIMVLLMDIKDKEYYEKCDYRYYYF